MSIYQDYPLQECATLAEAYIMAGASVFQKWTCQHCGARQSMEQENQFFRSGRCEECNEYTVIKACSYAVIMPVRRKGP